MTKILIYVVIAILTLSFVNKAFAGLLEMFGLGDSEKDNPPVPEFNERNIGRDNFYFESLADELESWMNGFGNNGNLNHLKELQTLNEDELKNLVKVFGKRTNTSVPLLSFSGNLFKWFEKEYDNWINMAYFNDLKKVFKPTKMWP